MICNIVVEVLDLMELDANSVIVVHGGGIYGDKDKTINRWCQQFYQLPENVQRRLVIENCERCFSIEDCLQVSSKINIPVVFDTHHFECYQQIHPDQTFHPPDFYIPDILKTWSNRNIKPKFHISQQGEGKIGHHSDFISEIPDYLLNIPEKFNQNIDIMVEAKMKEQAIFKLYHRYPFLNCLVDDGTDKKNDTESNTELKDVKQKFLVMDGLRNIYKIVNVVSNY